MNETLNRPLPPIILLQLFYPSQAPLISYLKQVQGTKNRLRSSFRHGNCFFILRHVTSRHQKYLCIPMKIFLWDLHHLREASARPAPGSGVHFRPESVIYSSGVFGGNNHTNNISSLGYILTSTWRIEVTKKKCLRNACLMMLDDTWWCLMMLNDTWWCLMTLDDSWWRLIFDTLN